MAQDTPQPLLSPHRQEEQEGKEGRSRELTRTVSLSSAPGKTIEQNVLEVVSKQRLLRNVVGSSKHGFTKERSCLTKLVAFYSEVTSLVEKGRAVDVVYFAFSKAQPATGTKTKIRLNHFLSQNISSKVFCYGRHCSYLFTESQNRWGWKGPPEIL